MQHALVIGSQGTIGQAIVSELEKSYKVIALSRADTDYSAQSLEHHAERLKQTSPFTVIVCCIGVLHDETVFPEKSLKDIDAKRLLHYFHINSVLPMLCLQKFVGLLDKKSNSVFACLSAMVGSIADNELGGWYGYRSSKAALNMLVKNTSIEVKRNNKSASIIAIHPGTTIGKLSKPFASNIDPKKYYAPDLSAKRIVNVIEAIEPQQSGRFFNWDGEDIAY